MKLASRSTLHESLTVVRLGKFDWRISDASQPDLLLGFIERQRVGRFEVTWMSDPIRWGYTTTFNDALNGFADSARFTGEILPERAATLGAASNGRLVHRSTWSKRAKSQDSSVA